MVAEMYSRDPDILEFALDNDISYNEAKRKLGYHYVSLLKCGHFMELKSSWNVIYDNEAIANPWEAYCKACDSMVKIVKYAKVSE